MLQVEQGQQDQGSAVSGNIQAAAGTEADDSAEDTDNAEHVAALTNQVCSKKC